MGYFDDEDLINDGMSDEAEDTAGFEDLSSMSASFEDGTVAASGDTQPSNAAPEDVDTTVMAQPVKFASFEDLDSASGLANQNLGILLDVKLQLTVELGKTLLPIKKVLELTKGSVVTLDKVAGEPVELYANGKLIAHGEVVVIEDNFGLRITHITPPVKRIDTFNQMPHEVAMQKQQS